MSRRSRVAPLPSGGYSHRLGLCHVRAVALLQDEIGARVGDGIGVSLDEVKNLSPLATQARTPAEEQRRAEPRPQRSPRRLGPRDDPLRANERLAVADEPNPRPGVSDPWLRRGARQSAPADGTSWWRASPRGTQGGGRHPPAPVNRPTYGVGSGYDPPKMSELPNVAGHSCSGAG